MAYSLSSIFQNLLPTRSAAIAKAQSAPLAVGVMPGRQTSLREDVMGQPRDSDYELLYRIYDINTDVSGSIDRWIGVVTGNDWQIRHKDPNIKPDEALKTEIERITTWLKNPNPARKIKFHRLVQETIIDLGVSGDAYWYIIRDAEGIPQEITNIHPSTMKVQSDEHGVVLGYIQEMNGKVAAQFKPEEIMHLRLPSRKSDLYGQSPLERAMEELSQDLKALQANKSLLDNGMSPSAILMISESVTDVDQIKQLQQQISQKHSGTSKWHKLMALAGVKDLKPWGHSLKDMQFTELRALATSKIATVYGVPKLYLNQKDAADYATSEVLERDLYNNKGRMLQGLFNELITEDLIQAFNQDLIFEFNPPQFADTNALRKDAIEIHKQDPEAITANELRETYFGLPRLEDDNTTDDIPAESTTEEIDDNQDDKESAPEELEDEDTTKSLVTKATDDDIDPYAIERDQRMEELEQDLYEPISTHFTDQEADYLTHLPEDLTEESLDTYIDANKDALDAAFALLLGSLLYQPLNAGVTAAKQQMYETSGDTPEGNLKIDLSLRFDQVNPVVQRYIQNDAFAHVQGINHTTREQLRATLAEAMRKGENVTQISDRIAAVFESARSYRTTMIARTETAQAFAYANYEALNLLYKDGLVKYRKWLTAPEDGRTCFICQPLNGYTIRFDAKYPDELEPAHVHPQCRCTEIGLLGDEDDLEDWRRV